MQFPIPDDLRDLIDRKMARGGYASHEELLRRALEFWAEHCETLVCLDRAIDDMESGRMRPWEEFERVFRAKEQSDIDDPQHRRNERTVRATDATHPL